MQFIKKGKLIVSFSNRTIRIWDIGNQKVHVDPMIHNSIINRIEVNEELSIIISGCNDGTIYLWDMGSGKLRKNFRAHKDGVEYLSLSYNGKMLASGGYDLKLKIWNMPACSLDAIVEDEDDSYIGAPRPRFIGKSMRLACWFGDNMIRIYDLNDGRQKACLDTGQSIKHYTLTDDGELVIVECENHEIMVWNTNTHKCIRKFRGQVLTEGDICAISQDFNYCSWRAVPYGNVMSIEHIGTQEKQVWIQRHTLSALPKRPIWIGTEGAFLYSYQLEDLK